MTDTTVQVRIPLEPVSLEGFLQLTRRSVRHTSREAEKSKNIDLKESGRKKRVDGTEPNRLPETILIDRKHTLLPINPNNYQQTYPVGEAQKPTEIDIGVLMEKNAG